MEKVQKLDAARRINIPLKICKKFNFMEKQAIEISICYGEICIQKFSPENIPQRPYIGIVRNLDLLNRACIPIEMLKTLKISSGDKFQLYTKDGKIFVKKL